MLDQEIRDLISSGRLRVWEEEGLVFAPQSNTPWNPVGAMTKKGYLRICISVRGKQRHVMAHRVVYVSAFGPLPDGWEVDHMNGTKRDNRLSNLEAVSGAENMRRATMAGAFHGNGRQDGIRDEKGQFGKRAAGALLDGREWREMPGGGQSGKGGG